jgi:hypothetical protein
VQPGDILVMQETPEEGIARYISNVFKINTAAQLVRQRDLSITGTGTNP